MAFHQQVLVRGSIMKHVKRIWLRYKLDRLLEQIADARRNGIEPVDLQGKAYVILQDLVAIEMRGMQ
jgi:hypothetical protein